MRWKKTQLRQLKDARRCLSPQIEDKDNIRDVNYLTRQLHR